jgi:DNA modification methylase
MLAPSNPSLLPSAAASPVHDRNTQPPLPPEPGSGRGRRHGTSSDEPFDRWFRYPAGFASDYAGLLLDQLGVQAGGTIVDPFTGSGVTGTATRRADMSFAGIETHPLIAELAALKLQLPPAHPSGLVEAAARIADIAAANVDREGAAPDLVKQSFDSEVLRQLLSIRHAIQGLGQETWSPYLKWALLSTLRDVASVRVGWPYQRPTISRQAPHADPVARFRRRAAMMAEDLAILTRTEGPSCGDSRATVVCGDARDERAWRQCVPAPADGCVSSPPYLNNFDYADATRLELYFWGDVTTWAEMCRGVRSGMIVATTQQSKVQTGRDALEALSRYGMVGGEIEALTQRLAAEKKERKRGKEYNQVVPSYFLGISQVLENLSHALKPGAPIVWLVGDSAPYGVYIDTPTIIGRLGVEHGLSVEQDSLLWHRGNRWAGIATRHQEKLSERLLLLRQA